MKIFFVSIFLTGIVFSQIHANNFGVSSPDGKIKVLVSSDHKRMVIAHPVELEVCFPVAAAPIDFHPPIVLFSSH